MLLNTVPAPWTDELTLDVGAVTRWRFDPEVWCRSAGFPGHLLAALACPETCAALKQVEDLERRLAAIENEALTLLRDASANANAETRTSLRRLRRAVKRRRDLPFELHSHGDAWVQFVESRNELLAERDALLMQAAASHRVEHETTRRWLRAFMTNGSALHAAHLSSRSLATAFERGFGAANDDAKGRALERRAVLFLQRLAGKNEMLSFFGPCFWARIDATASSVVAQELAATSTRSTFFETWAMRAITRRLEADPVFAQYCVPRLNHGCAVEGATLYYPVGHRTTLTSPQITVLGWCDGSRPLHAIRALIAAEPELQMVLAELLERGILRNEIPLPTVDAHPETYVRRFLESLPRDVGAVWVERLEGMVELRDRLSRTSTLAERRELEQQLDQLFHDSTGEPFSRGAGLVHGARHLTYEDCSRDVAVTFGGTVVEDLAQLEPVLDVARWIARAWAEAFERKLIAVYERLAGGLDSVDFLRFVRETQWVTEGVDLESQVERRLQQAWIQHLEATGRGNVDELEPGDFRAVLQLLPEPDDGRAPWLAATDVHSASVMLAAASVDELATGQYQLVLSQLYKSVPMIIHPAVQPFCGARDEVLGRFASWLRSPVLQLVDPPTSYHRSNINLPDLPGLYEGTMPGTSSRFPPERVVRVGDLEVTKQNGHLWLRTRDGRLSFSLLAARWAVFHRKLLAISPFPQRSTNHTARLTMGRWVLRRAQWNASVEGLRAAWRWPPFQRLARVRAWQRELGLPDRVFVKGADPDAIYVDLRSSLFADVLIGLARNVDELAITEMLPLPEQLWLADGQGQRYGCELRVTAFC